MECFLFLVAIFLFNNPNIKASSLNKNNNNPNSSSSEEEYREKEEDEEEVRELKIFAFYGSRKGQFDLCKFIEIGAFSSIEDKIKLYQERATLGVAGDLENVPYSVNIEGQVYDIKRIYSEIHSSDYRGSLECDEYEGRQGAGKFTIFSRNVDKNADSLADEALFMLYVNNFVLTGPEGENMEDNQ